MADGTTKVYFEGSEDIIEELILLACKNVTNGKIKIIQKDAICVEGEQDE